MKWFRGFLAATIIVLALIPVKMDAAPVNHCYRALMGCLDDCNSMPPPLNYGCATGCNIGYLNCIW